MSLTRNQKPRCYQPARLGANRREYPPVKHWHAKQYHGNTLLAGHIQRTVFVISPRTWPARILTALASSADILLDRGRGKPPQAHTGEDDTDIAHYPADRRAPGRGLIVWHPASQLASTRPYCSARQIVASPHSYSRANSAIVSPAV